MHYELNIETSFILAIYIKHPNHNSQFSIRNGSEWVKAVETKEIIMNYELCIMN